MTVRKIITLPDPILRIQARKVVNFTSELQYLISDMVETMRSARGVGLAAPQVGIDKQLIVVEYSDQDHRTDPPSAKNLYIVINPEIFQYAREIVSGREACLSVPGFYGEVNRYHRVIIKGYSRHGRPFQMKASGWLARVFQHEIDHVRGVLYTDIATQVWRTQDDLAQASSVI
jgi:peptide deformylase